MMGAKNENLRLGLLGHCDQRPGWISDARMENNVGAPGDRTSPLQSVLDLALQRCGQLGAEVLEVHRKRESEAAGLEERIDDAHRR